jgi:Tfp pilus assembly protein FimV
MIILRFFYPALYTAALRYLIPGTVYLLLLTLSSASFASTDNPGSTGEAKRIEVYPLSQNFHDVASGETLQQIVLQLLPNRPAQRAHLMQDIVQLNPSAFVKQNPNRLKAGVRLWLPNNPPQPAPQPQTRNRHIESFSWGQVIRHQQP